ncbi:hypothetical protein ACFV4T_37325 [Streptomyces sp. NPDC059755]|uniref:hypothetical protein n=1 Tax=Streptomyces sp. NPDC059755 TaxID=3346934 RepID=UPI00365D262D
MQRLLGGRAAARWPTALAPGSTRVIRLVAEATIDRVPDASRPAVIGRASCFHALECSRLA